MNNFTNIVVVGSIETENDIQILHERIQRWEKEREEYWEEIGSLNNIFTDFNKTIRKEICVNGLIVNNRLINQANKLIDKFFNKEKERWGLLRSIENMF